MASRRLRSESSIDIIDWFEVFLRVNPDWIFNCILVSKEWLKVVTRPEFQSSYEKRWKTNSKLVGFLDHDVEIIYLWATRQLDCMIKTSIKPLQNLGSFESKTTYHMLFRPHRGGFTVIHRIAAVDGLSSELPPPPVRHTFYTSSAIMSESPNCFKVILAAIYGVNTLCIIQTFSSSTLTWEKFVVEIPVSSKFLLGNPGFVSSKGVVYWPIKFPLDAAKLAAYDSNNQGKILLISPPPKHDSIVNIFSYAHYGVSSQDSVYCATHVDGRVKDAWDLGTIKLYVLGDDEDQRWILMNNVELKSMWEKHPTLLEPIFGGKRPSLPFTFVSFVPGTTECFHVKLGEVIFRYDLQTRELDRMFGSYDPSPGARPTYFHPHSVNVPVTAADLGIWPDCSSIPHLH